MDFRRPANCPALRHCALQIFRFKVQVQGPGLRPIKILVAIPASTVAVRISPCQPIIVSGLLVVVLSAHLGMGVLIGNLFSAPKPKPAAPPLPLLQLVAINQTLMPALNGPPTPQQPNTLPPLKNHPLPPRPLRPPQASAATFKAISAVNEPPLAPVPATPPDEPPDHSASVDSPPLMSAPAPAPEPASSAVAYLDNPPPSYPSTSRRAGEQGTVLLRVKVEASGLPGHIELHKSSGFERLDAVAKNSVQGWRFTPSRLGNTAVNTWVEIPITFRLENTTP